MKRHVQDTYYVIGEGDLAMDRHGESVCRPLSAASEIRRFRFSRLGPVGEAAAPALNQILAEAMTRAGNQPDSGAGGEEAVPAGFTYLGQFVDHDLTKNVGDEVFGSDISVDELLQGRSPALDLDSLYGRGPTDALDRRFYAADGVSLRTGTTAAVPIDAGTNTNRDGFDLPRVGVGRTKSDERAPLIADDRNDENLAVAQTHLAFLHFHNRVVERLSTTVPSKLLFDRARGEVVRHYQWMLRHDYLPKIVDPLIVKDVFENGRSFFEVPDSADASGAAGAGSVRSPGDSATMPIEFSVAAFRLGHSMVRGLYEWNRVFNSTPPAQGDPLRLGAASLFQLFTFSGVSGNLTPTPPEDLAVLDDPNSGTFLRLPTNWISDWRRQFDFTPLGRAELTAPAALGGGNVTKRIDTLLVEPLEHLPAGSFGEKESSVPVGSMARNLAFRNLVRANMVHLASGQQMAELFGAKKLTEAEILTGDGTGADVTSAGATQLDTALRTELVTRTPLWFYVLREAELNGGRLGAVGGRIVAEVFHRAMECSVASILREPDWRPQFGEREGKFEMIDLLLFALGEGGLNPLGD
ncbi:MAG: heme peroxidase [Pseudonocardia sp.]|nr:heme peroxidase [Pseudonocardia sp.]